MIPGQIAIRKNPIKKMRIKIKIITAKAVFLNSFIIGLRWNNNNNSKEQRNKKSRKTFLYIGSRPAFIQGKPRRRSC